MEIQHVVYYYSVNFAHDKNHSSSRYFLPFIIFLASLARSSINCCNIIFFILIWLLSVTKEGTKFQNNTLQNIANMTNVHYRLLKTLSHSLYRRFHVRGPDWHGIPHASIEPARNALPRQLQRAQSPERLAYNTVSGRRRRRWAAGNEWNALSAADRPILPGNKTRGKGERESKIIMVTRH